jgi:hypothetical protein
MSMQIFSFVLMNESFPGVIVSPCKAGATGKIALLSHLPAILSRICSFIGGSILSRNKRKTK